MAELTELTQRLHRLGQGLRRGRPAREWSERPTSELDRRLTALKAQWFDPNVPSPPPSESFPSTPQIPAPPEPPVEVASKLDRSLRRIRQIATPTSHPEIAQLGELAELAVKMCEVASEDEGLAGGLMGLADYLESRILEIDHKLGMQRQSHELASRLAGIHTLLLAGQPVDFGALAELADLVIRNVERRFQPVLSLELAAGVSEMIAQHSLNVAHVAAFLAMRDQTGRAIRRELVIAALVQDVGMRLVPERIFRQAGPLPTPDRALVQRHPLESRRILAILEPAAWEEIIRAADRHHERLDGSGYPSGLSGSSVDPMSRLLAVADVYAALRAPRGHRPAASARQALTHTLAEGEAGRLDRDAVRRLLDLSLYPAGSFVELDTGEVAQVVASQLASHAPPLAALPIVRILKDASGRRVPGPVYRNLAHCADCQVVRELPQG